MSEPRREEFRVPDIAGTVEGWRAWGVPVESGQFGTAVKLYSVSAVRHFWKPREIAEASCNNHHRRAGYAPPGTTIPVHEVPEENCTCGFYSAKTLAHLMGMSYHQYDAERQGMFHVIGQVANWGKVIEGSQGWRAQFSYPVHLYVPFEAWQLAKPLAKTYGVPVSLKNILVPARRVAI